MATRRPARPTPPDVDVLRAALGQGKIVRVGIAPSDQFPDGVTGRVRRIGDPGVDGDEFLFVEVPVGGTKDVLPFAAKDLTTAPARKPTVPPGPASRPTAAAVPKAQQSAAIPVRSAVPAPPSPTDRSSPPMLPTALLAPTVLAAPTTVDPVGSPPQPGKPAGRSAAGPPRMAGHGVRGKRAPVTITVSTAGDESAAWRVEARIGAKVAVRPTAIPPSRVWEIVQSLGDTKLSEVVQTLLEDHRRSTQARADVLAAELAGLQAELNSFPTS